MRTRPSVLSAVTALALVGALFSLTSPAQSRALIKVHQFGSSSYEWPAGVAVQGSTVAVAGTTYGTLPVQTSAGGGDMFVRSLTSTGTVRWTRQFGTDQDEELFDLSATADSLYIAGETPGTLSGQSSQGALDMVLRRYDTAGNVVWTRQFGTSGSDSLNAVAATPSGIYVAGQTYGNFPGYVHAGNGDLVVRKYDTAGNAVWTRQIGTGSSEYAKGIAVSGENVFIVLSTQGTFPGESSSGGQDLVVVSLTTDGDPAWTEQYGGAGSEFPQGIAARGSNVYVVGATESQLPGQTHAGGSDAFVRSWTTDGQHRWTRQFGTLQQDSLTTVTATDMGVFTTGSTTGVLGAKSFGQEDIFVRKFTPSGGTVWTLQAGTDANDYGAGTAVSASGVYAGGEVNGVFPGQIGAGDTDVAVLRLGGGRPDALLRLSKSATWLGDDTYLPKAQSVLIRVSRGRSVSYTVGLQNDGEITERLRVDGCADTSTFKVRYVANGNNVTEQVRAGKWRTKSLPPGGLTTLTVKITVLASAVRGETAGCAVRVFSTTNQKTADRVTPKVRVR